VAQRERISVHGSRPVQRPINHQQGQDATDPPPPVCNIVSLSPCHDKCDADYEARAIECGKIQDEAQRRSCQDSSHEKYKSCTEECDKEASPSKSKCRKKWEDCINYGPWECARPGSGDAGKSKCSTCWDQCNSGDPPSPDCRKCLF
jgi:hypothetical protein